MTWGAIGAAATVVVGGSLVGSIFGSPSAGGVSSSQSGMSQTIFGDQQYFTGLLQKLIANPGSVTSTPGYQFFESQGEQAIQRTGAASGNKGATGQALVGYAEGYASTALTQQEALLSSLSGLTAPTSAGQAGGNAISAQQNQFTQMGQLLASLGYLANRGGTTPGTTPSDGGGGGGGGSTPWYAPIADPGVMPSGPGAPYTWGSGGGP